MKKVYRGCYSRGCHSHCHSNFDVFTASLGCCMAKAAMSLLICSGLFSHSGAVEVPLQARNWTSGCIISAACMIAHRWCTWQWWRRHLCPSSGPERHDIGPPRCPLVPTLCGAGAGAPLAPARPSHGTAKLPCDKVGMRDGFCCGHSTRAGPGAPAKIEKPKHVPRCIECPGGCNSQGKRQRLGHRTIFIFTPGNTFSYRGGGDITHGSTLRVQTPASGSMPMAGTARASTTAVLQMSWCWTRQRSPRCSTLCPSPLSSGTRYQTTQSQ